MLFKVFQVGNSFRVACKRGDGKNLINKRRFKSADKALAYATKCAMVLGGRVVN